MENEEGRERKGKERERQIKEGEENGMGESQGNGEERKAGETGE